MLRSIADIARSEGEDLDDIEARLSCVGVLALGARTKQDNDAELVARALPNLAERSFPSALARSRSNRAAMVSACPHSVWNSCLSAWLARAAKSPKEEALKTRCGSWCEGDKPSR
jgi:hypothetical protein